MKRFIALLLVFALCFSLVACVNSEIDETHPDSGKHTDKSVAVILQAGGLGDQGYNDNAKIGLDAMIKKYGIKGTLVEAPQPAEADTFVRQLASDGHQLIICLDWTIVDYVREASKDYPNTFFLILGKAAPGPGMQENLIEPYSGLHEWAFSAALASILIAKDGNELFEDKSRPGCKVAVIRAGESVNATRTRGAYQQVVQEIYPEAEIYFDYTGSYTDSALDQQIAENLIKNQGVEVIWPCIGTGALPVFTTCKLNNAYALGCDSDQDAIELGTIPTSVLHNTTMMVINVVEEYINGTLKGTNEYYWGLESGVVGLTDFSTIEHCEGINKENLKKIKSIIKEYNEKIISGEFIVYDSFQNSNMEFTEWTKKHPGVDYTDWVKAGRPEK